MSTDTGSRTLPVRPAILAMALTAIVVATGEGAWARTRQECSVQYARCINRAIDMGRSDKTLINCDKQATDCFKNASDKLAHAPAELGKNQMTTPAGKVKALAVGKTPVVHGGNLRR
jgi:hypothetical protein